jgi:hypothetical protein
MEGTADPELLRIMLSGDDFQRTEEFLKAAGKHSEAAIEFEALLHSAILFYTRPFSDNEPKKSPLPAAARSLTGLDVKALLGTDASLHYRLITLRNKVIAHAESEFFPARSIELQLVDCNSHL